MVPAERDGRTTASPNGEWDGNKLLDLPSKGLNKLELIKRSAHLASVVKLEVHFVAYSLICIFTLRMPNQLKFTYLMDMANTAFIGNMHEG